MATRHAGVPGRASIRPNPAVVGRIIRSGRFLLAELALAVIPGVVLGHAVGRTSRKPGSTEPAQDNDRAGANSQPSCPGLRPLELASRRPQCMRDLGHRDLGLARGSGVGSDSPVAPICSRPAVHGVVAVLAVEGVVSALAQKSVIAETAREDVDSGRSSKCVGRGRSADVLDCHGECPRPALSLCRSQIDIDRDAEGHCVRAVAPVPVSAPSPR